MRNLPTVELIEIIKEQSKKQTEGKNGNKD